MENGFRGLRVWKKGIDLAVYIYQKTNEGDELGTNKQSIRHFYIAKGSSAEVLTQTIIAQKIGYLDDEAFRKIETETTEISKMLSKLIEARLQ